MNTATHASSIAISNSAGNFQSTFPHHIQQEADMAFVSEQCNEEEMREILKLKPYLPFGWYGYMAVDREKNIRLLSLGGKGSTPETRGEPPDYLLLIIREHLVPFEIRFTSENFSDGWVYSMDVQKMQVPPELKKDIEEIQQCIRESILALWSGFHR